MQPNNKLLQGYFFLLTPLLLAAVLLAAGCGGSSWTAMDDLSKDGPPRRAVDADRIPDAIPRVEPITAAGNKNPYTVWGKTYRLLPTAAGYRETGIASWYGRKFHGRKTANGETFSMYAMTAAHRTLPIPCYVRVTNLANRRQVIVRINDRGPFHGDRLIDLSYAAAKKLGYEEGGTAQVEVVAIDPVAYQSNPVQAPQVPVVAQRVAAPSPLPKPEVSVASNHQAATNQPGSANRSQLDGRPAPNAYLQVGAYTTPSAAHQMRAQIATLTDFPVLIQDTAADPHARALFKVLVGPIATRAKLETLRRQLHSQGLFKTFVVYQINALGS